MFEKHRDRVPFYPGLCARPSVGVDLPGVGLIPVVQVGKLRHRGANFLVRGHTVEW